MGKAIILEEKVGILSPQLNPAVSYFVDRSV